jgi:hypothetical protein
LLFVVVYDRRADDFESQEIHENMLILVVSARGRKLFGNLFVVLRFLAVIHIIIVENIKICVTGVFQIVYIFVRRVIADIYIQIFIYPRTANK